MIGVKPGGRLCEHRGRRHNRECRGRRRGSIAINGVQGARWKQVRTADTTERPTHEMSASRTTVLKVLLTGLR